MITLDQMSCTAPMPASMQAPAVGIIILGTVLVCSPQCLLLCKHRAVGIILGTALVYSPQCLLLCKHRAVGLILGTVLVVQHL